MDLIEDGQPIDASILNALYQKMVDAEAKSNAVITATGNLEISAISFSNVHSAAGLPSRALLRFVT